MLKKLVLMIASLVMLASCGGPAPTSQPSTDSKMDSFASSLEELPVSVEDSSSSFEQPSTFQQVTVNFYADYNTYSESIRNIYVTQKVTNGDKLEKPADPEAPFTDFPTFLGWSTRPLIEDTNLLWDFDKNIVNIKGSTLIMYGIWSN